MKTYCGKHHLGAIRDFTEWWTEKEWKEHKRYVEELKALGDYLKEVETCITLKYCPELDEPTFVKSTPRFIIFDTNG